MNNEKALTGQKETKERILDMAEALFGREGYHCTSLRKLTSKARVNLGAVNYHFGSKEALLDAVFARRLRPVNEIRVRNLKAIGKGADEAGEAPSVEAILHAFFQPVMELIQSKKDGATNFAILVGRSMTESDPTVRHLFMTHMKPTFSLAFELLCRALSHHPRELIFARFQFTMGALSRCMCLQEDSPLLPEGLSPPKDAGVLLVPFAAAGMEAP